jgi:hypothetical protein
MPLTIEQLREAFGELSGQRGDVLIEFVGASACRIRNAMLLPAEKDNLLKLTDGTREFLVDAERVAWIEIGAAISPLSERD